MPSVDARLEKLFQRGIDPADVGAAAAQSIHTWPDRDAMATFVRACDEAVIKALQLAAAAPVNSLPAQAAYTILEHEQMHHETLLYIYHQLPYALKTKPLGSRPPLDGEQPEQAVVRVPAGTATLGAARGSIPFGWDNEFEQHAVEVNAFTIDAHSVTNADYAGFVEAGGPVPPFWRSRAGRWFQRTMFEELPLPLSWPVYVSRDEAVSYAQWKGGRLPTEAEYHRAAYGAPKGEERSAPWGSEAFSSERGNCDYQSFDPAPAGAHPSGASAWGVHDLVGNGWEWTATPFAPLPGFAPMPTYPQYSADFFDGVHYVVKGGSAVTARELLRRSFRNWYRSNYPYTYAKFRLVREDGAR
jgi:formylglycine-generating enzyme required for sulfatase activity